MASHSHDSDDDYMSNDILNLCGDSRPGLLSKAAAKRVQGQRRHEELNKQNRTKSVRQLEKESRDTALQTAIHKDNKGFALMQKMGFKPGMSLGKTGQDGRKEPVPLELKVNRSGLGHDQEVKRKREAKSQMMMVVMQKRKKTQQHQIQDYRSRKRNELMEKLTEKDLWNSQKVCHQLDEKKEVTDPEQIFFWPPVIQEINPEEDDGDTSEEEEKPEEDELTAGEKLEVLTEYLRSTHYYCVWCGTSFNDTEDMQQNCPGNTRQDHDD